ncbi:DNA polymerase III subunit alpha [Falsibacillus pallidus]|uniref:DNA polymerase III subunit alpha n=1 Tax=Falsibacillus pallidus TaxID=493781 RepID=A0A370GKS6_9BACI|nr:DNA polymerase III subunit alpha [Falsibacillus pallidus]RDI44257.1 DNA polymerase III catalytic subunit DnaE type [Falsibacillus pallidus]
MSFIHLQITTSYSLLSSTISIEQLIDSAVADNHKALAITDRNVLYGAIPFYKACKEKGIKPIIGMTADVLKQGEPDEAYPLVLLAKTVEGYRNLMKISSVIQTKSPNGIPLKWLRGYSRGLIALTPGRKGEIESHLLNEKVEEAEESLRNLKGAFEEGCFFLSLQKHGLPGEEGLLAQLRNLSKKGNVPLAAANDVQYLHKDDSFTLECLWALRDGLKLSDDERPKLGSSSFYLKTKQEMAELFTEDVDALENTIKIAEACNVEFEFHKRLLPKYPLPPGQQPHQYLEDLCSSGLDDRVKEAGTEYKERLTYELDIIRKMGFSDYFLIVWDFMKYARDKGILTGPGRGSAAGSLVAYVLKITDVDPIANDLLFERFLNPERISMPDIDIDFPDHRRDEILQYVAGKYGAMHVAQIITFGTLAAKAALRDAARVFGCSSKELEQFSRLVPSKPGLKLKDAYQESPALKEFIDQSDYYKKLFSTALKIEGLPRHASTHAAGVVISDSQLVDEIPIQQGQNGLTLTQYPMDVLEEIGLLKMDFLGLRNLSLLERIITSIKIGMDKKIDLDRIPYDDEATYKLLSRGETTGIFQLESDGMRKVLMRLKPTRFEDIVAVNALYRPGPMENIPLYIERKHGIKPIEYPHQDLQEFLKVTYGVIVYQEQIMQIASKMAGFSLGEADLLRRAVSKKKKDVLDQERAHFVKGAVSKGYNEQTAHSIYDLIVRFADYGFNRSHAVAYSMIACQLAYLKTHYPLYFMASLLTSVIGNEDKIAQYIKESQQRGINILPPSINSSQFPFMVEREGIRFSIGAIKGIGAAALRGIVEARKKKPFLDLFDFCVRVPSKAVNRKTLESLIFAGCFDEFGQDRATLLASIDAALDHAELVSPEDQGYDLFEDEAAFQIKPKYTEVDPMPLLEKLSFEKQALGIYLSDHPVSPYQVEFDQAGCVPLNELGNEKKGKSAGAYITSVKTIRTKKGDVMAFINVSDQWSDLECVAFPNVYNKISALCKEGGIVVIQGNIEERNGKKQLIIQKMMTIEDAVKDKKPMGKKLYVKVPVDKQNPEGLNQIHSILQRFKGSACVILVYENQEKVLQLSRKDWVNPTEECLYELKKLLGEEHVFLRQ